MPVEGPIGLAVYGATAAFGIWLLNRFVIPVGRIAGLALTLAPLLFTGKAMVTAAVVAPVDILYDAEPFASQRAQQEIRKTANPLLVDVVGQMLPWRKAVREAVLDGRLPLWNPHILSGEPLAAVQQPMVFHPFTWIGLVLPLPQAWTLELTLRLFLALACAFAFFRAAGSTESVSLFGGVAWGLSDFLIFYWGFPLGASVAVFPLVLLGLMRLAERADTGSTLLTVAALVLVVVAGHPETLLFTVTGAGLFFLGELGAASRERRPKAVGLAIVAGVAALGVSAVALLPFLEIVPQTWHYAVRKITYANIDRSDSLPESFRRLILSIVPYAYGTLGKSEVIPRLMLPAGYAGSLLFPLACAGLLGRSRRRWLWVAMALLGLALNIRLAGVTDAMAALPLFDIALLEYFIFLWLFGLVALAVLGLERLPVRGGVRPFLVGTILVTVFIVLVVRHRSEGLQVLEMSTAYLRERVLLQVLPLLIALGLVLLRAAPFPQSLIVILFVALLVGQRRFEEAEVYPTYPAAAFYPPVEILKAIPRGEPARIASLGYSLLPNVATMYGLEDVRGYTAMLFRPLAETYGLWCEPPGIYFSRVTDPSRPFLGFLNVRYVLAPPQFAMPAEWRFLREGNGLRLFENPQALARVFVPRNVLWSENSTSQLSLVAQIADFADQGVAWDVASSRRGWQPNAPALIRVESYSGQRLDLEVQASSPTFLGTSIPAWRGWRLSIDGRPARLYPFNHAFLGFQVPAGRHAVTLRYLPMAFLVGAAVSLVSVLVLLSVALRARRRQA